MAPYLLDNLFCKIAGKRQRLRILIEPVSTRRKVGVQQRVQHKLCAYLRRHDHKGLKKCHEKIEEPVDIAYTRRIDHARVYVRKRELRMFVAENLNVS